MSLDRDAFYIDGGWRAPATDATLQVVSPHSEEVIATVPEAAPRSPPLDRPSTTAPGRG